MSQQIRLSDEQLEKLPQKLRATYVHWQNGENMFTLLTKATFYRHRKLLLEHGIDINTVRPKRAAPNIVPLIRVLEAGQVPIPDWAQDQNLIHTPKRA